MVEACDDAQVMAQVGVVEAARSELNKSRTMMLLRMRRVLTPDQRVKFVMLQQQDAGSPSLRRLITAVIVFFEIDVMKTFSSSASVSLRAPC